MNPSQLDRMRADRAQGWSDQDIAARYGITRQAVHAGLGPRTPAERSAAAERAARLRPPAPEPLAIDPAEFARRVRAWRAERNLSQPQAAALLCVNPHTLRSWEVGRTGCSLAAAILRLTELTA